jgi:hypothetical protein
MADKDVKIHIGVKGSENAAKSVADINKEIKEARQQLAQAQKGTKEWEAAFKRLAAAKNEIKDLKMSIAAAGNSIDTLQTSINSVASGFQALSGIVALVGTENEELVKTMVKLQAVSNIANAVAGFKDLNAVFTAIKVNLLTNPLFILAAILTAIGVTIVALKDKFEVFGKIVDGVGNAIKSVLSLVGLYSQKVEALNKMNDELTKKYEQQTATIERQMKIAQAEGKSTIELERQKLQLQKDYIANQIAILRLKEMEGKLSEEDSKKLADLRKQLIDVATEQKVLEIRQNKEISESVKKELEERKKKYEEYQKALQERRKKQLEEELNALEFEKQKALITAQDKEKIEIEYANKKLQLIKNTTLIENKEKLKMIDELNKEIELMNLKYAKEQQDRRDEERKKEFQKTIEAAMEDLEFKKNVDLIKLEIEQKNNEILIQQGKLSYQQLLEERLQLEEYYLEQKKNIIDNNELLSEQEKIEQKKKLEREYQLFKLKAVADANEKEKQLARKLEEDKRNIRMQLTSLSFQAIDNLSNLFFQLQLNRVKKGSAEEKELQRKKFNLDKGISATKAIINTAEAITKTLTAFAFPLNIVFASLTAAAGAAQVASILAQKFPENESASVSASVPDTRGGVSVNVESAEPIRPLLPQGESTEGIKKTDNQVIKAVVVETDITNTQRRVKSIIESSTF